MTIFRSDMANLQPRRRWLWIVAVALGALFAIAAGLVLRARAFDRQLPPPLAVNLALPITLPDGRAATLGQLVRPGIPTVINLWASWCGPCKLEAPTVVHLRQHFGDRMNLIYLNVRDEDATAADLASYLGEIGLPANAYARLTTDRISTLTGAANNLVPRTMMFDAQGAPTAMITGYKPLALARVANMVES